MRTNYTLVRLERHCSPLATPTRVGVYAPYGIVFDGSISECEDAYLAHTRNGLPWSALEKRRKNAAKRDRRAARV